MASLNIDISVKGAVTGIRNIDSVTKALENLDDTMRLVDFKKFTADLTKLGSVFKSISGNVKSFAGDVSKINNAFNTAKADVEKYKAKLAELSAENQSLRNTMSGVNTEIDEQKIAFEQGKVSEQNYKAEAARLRAELAALRLQQANNRKETTAANGSYREAQQRLTALGQTIRNASGGFRSMTPELRAQIAEYRKLNAELTKFDKKMGLNFRNVGNYPQLLSAISPQLSLLAGRFGLVVAAVAALGSAYKTMVQFDSGLLNVSKTTGLAGAELDGLSNGLISLSKQLQVISPEKLTQYATVAGQLGVKGRENILAFTSALAQLETASNITGEEGGAEIARTLTLIDGGVQNVRKFGDEIVNLGNNFAATEKEILSNAESVAQNTAIYGFSRQQVLAYAAATKSLGLEAEVVGSAFQKTLGIFESAIRTGDGLSEILKVTGGTAADLRREFATNASGVFQKYVEGLNRIREAGGSVAAQLTENGIIDIRNRRVIQTLATGYDTLNRAMITVKDSAGAMADEFETASTKLSNQVNKIKVAWENLILTVDDGRGVFGKFIGEAASGFASFLGEIERVVASSSWKEFWSRLTEFGQSGGGRLMTQSDFTNAFTSSRDFLRDRAGTRPDEYWSKAPMDYFKGELKAAEDTYNKIYKAHVNLEAAVAQGRIKATKNERDQYNIQASLAQLHYTKLKQIARRRGITVDPVAEASKIANATTGGAASDKKGGGIRTDYVGNIDSIAQRGLFSAAITATEGLQTITDRTREEYRKLISSIDEQEKKGLAANKNNASERVKISAKAATERVNLNTAMEAKIAEQTRKFAQDTSDQIASIEERAGIVRILGRKRELEQSEAYYNEQVNLNRENAAVVTSLEEARLVARQKINEKYDGKAVENTRKQYDKIEKLINKPYSSTANSKKIQEELDKRLKVISEYYENIRKILSGAGLPTFYTKFLEMGSKAQATGAAPERSDLTNRLRNQIGRSVLSGIDQVASSITSIGQKNYEIELRYQELREGKTAEQIVQLNKLLRLEKQIATGIGNTVNSLFNAISGAVGSVMKTTLTEQLGSVFSGEIDFKKFADDNKKSLYALGGQLVGSLVSGMSSPANTGAQAIGGALGGASAGFAIGNVPGAIVGGLLGALSGIFSAGTAKKQLRLQEMQLAEQRKQTALAERAAALSYTSGIIGQRTNAGIVTGAGRNEFGDITFRIQGKDLVASFNREMQSR